MICRNLISEANILHVGRNAVETLQDNKIDYIFMKNRNRFSYILLSTFNLLCEDFVPVFSCFDGNNPGDEPWSRAKFIVDKVHKHICGHATISDVKILVDKNDTLHI